MGIVYSRSAARLNSGEKSVFRVSIYVRTNGSISRIALMAKVSNFCR